MFTNDPYAIKTIEYLTGIGFLVLFVMFWRYANGDALALAARVHAWSGQLAGWFSVPHGVAFHPAHAWVRPDGPNVFTVGLDDFAQQLVGPLQAVDLPPVGTQLRAGAPAWTLRAGGKSLDMLSPVTGQIIDVNHAASRDGTLVNEDPYGRGWLLKLHVPQAAAATKNLLSGEAARRWMEQVSERLTASMTPELGHLCQDGGLPIHGIARGIDPDRWDEVARTFLHPDHPSTLST